MSARRLNWTGATGHEHPRQAGQPLHHGRPHQSLDHGGIAHPARAERVVAVPSLAVLPHLPVRRRPAHARDPSVDRRGAGYQLPRAVLPLLHAQSVEPRRHGVDEEPRRGDQRQGRGPARARQVQCRPEARLLGPVGPHPCAVRQRHRAVGCLFLRLHHDRPEATGGGRPCVVRDRRHPDLDRPRLCRHLGQGHAPRHDPRLGVRRLGLETPSQMVPSGSRQTLSTGPSNPSTGFGENILGEIAESAAVRLPDLATIFSHRAERLNALAPGHELEGFLRLIAALVAAQQVALAGLPPGSLPGPAQIAKARLARKAPLDPGAWPRDQSWRTALARILGTIDESILPEPARLARAALGSASTVELEALADRFLDGDVAAGEAARTVFVAAALQVVWTRMAALLDKADIDLGEAETGQCPACGSPPVAGVISPGGTKFGHRHLHCSLCATAWRYVRVRCVHCGSTDKISFRQLAGTSYLRAECCENCRGYSKVFYLESAKALEPLADDLGSLGLDVLVGEEGFARIPNPFVLGNHDGNN